MGEGVTNILGLITDLCVAENNIFLIEEPENDIHPKALKALLDLIASKADANHRGNQSNTTRDDRQGFG